MIENTCRYSSNFEKAIHNSRFDEKLWPTKDIVETTDGRRVCLRFDDRGTPTAPRRRAVAVGAGQTSLFDGREPI